MYFMEFKLQ